MGAVFEKEWTGMNGKNGKRKRLNRSKCQPFKFENTLITGFFSVDFIVKNEMFWKFKLLSENLRAPNERWTVR